ncbi:hypothetical protein GWI33_014903 [Rhynchophorus ferrugineus]|uniref:Uncharacterized protein n=1 Tax=Rhynchophorus ferrugineus TaxID=354439 RepID=A0A834I0Q9_RHYFE|nr:hypothetical protein GWI33_014903 [Rhynchophorus ferrugineus]
MVPRPYPPAPWDRAPDRRRSPTNHAGAPPRGPRYCGTDVTNKKVEWYQSMCRRFFSVELHSILATEPNGRI